jgi:hypothetical protein
MLQIIGWLGCLYLIVKALEIAGSADSYEPHEVNAEKQVLRLPAVFAISLAVVGALGFGIWLKFQGSALEVGAMQTETAELERQNECAEAATDSQGILDCFSQ